MIIGVDCGHTLTGSGTGSQGCGYKEEKLTRELGKEVITLLKKEGHTVVNCTVDKSNQQLVDRVAIANKYKLDLFVSIHFNACVNDTKGDGKTTGVECLVSHTGTKAYDEAKRVCDKIAKLGFKNRGVKVYGAYVLKNTKAPAFLIETCFIDDRDDMNLYIKKRSEVARAIVEGILNKTITTTTTNAKKGKYRVVVGSYEDKANAEKRQAEIKKKGIDSFLVFTEGI